MNQPSLFDDDESRRRRKDAIRRVDSNADLEWRRAAERAVRVVASQMAELTTDETAHWLALNYPEVRTHEERAWGPVMLDAARLRLIVNTKRVRESNMVSNHRRPKTIWRSLIWREKL